jgi:hypothetical protein
MKSQATYPDAKKGNLHAARELIHRLQPDPRLFHKLQGFVCPVIKPSGNRIPLALAEYMSFNSGLILIDSILLQHAPHGSSMTERLCYHPRFFGSVPAGNYILVDDVYTTGQTLKSLKTWIESNGGNVTGVWCLGSGPSLLFEPSRIMVKTLTARFPDIGEYFDIVDLTVPQIQYLLRLSSINRLFKIREQVQQKLLLL